VAEDGTFKVHGCAEDPNWVWIDNLPEPYLRIVHTCLDPYFYVDEQGRESPSPLVMPHEKHEIIKFQTFNTFQPEVSYPTPLSCDIDHQFRSTTSVRSIWPECPTRWCWRRESNGGPKGAGWRTSRRRETTTTMPPAELALINLRRGSRGCQMRIAGPDYNDFNGDEADY